MKKKCLEWGECSHLLKLTSSSSDLSVSVSSSVNFRFSRLKVIVCKNNTSVTFCISFFIIYKVMKYRKLCIKYNAYFKKAVFHSCENIKSCIFTAVKI